MFHVKGGRKIKYRIIRHILNKYSYIIYPAIIFIICFILSNAFNISSYSLKILVHMPLIFMYLMFRQLEIYWLFEDGIVMQRVRNSGHDEVFKNNMVTGIMLFTCSLISMKSSVAIPLFLAGLSNFVISSYYVKTLKKILKIPCKSKGH